MLAAQSGSVYRASSLQHACYFVPKRQIVYCQTDLELEQHFENPSNIDNHDHNATPNVIATIERIDMRALWRIRLAV